MIKLTSCGKPREYRCVLKMPRSSQPFGSRFEGRAAVRTALAGRFEGLPDVHYGDAEHFVDEAAQTGTSKWLLTGTAPDGTRHQVRGCDFYRFRHGKVIAPPWAQAMQASTDRRDRPPIKEVAPFALTGAPA